VLPPVLLPPVPPPLPPLPPVPVVTFRGELLQPMPMPATEDTKRTAKANFRMFETPKFFRRTDPRGGKNQRAPARSSLERLARADSYA
jgi:hypothetical protein